MFKALLKSFKRIDIFGKSVELSFNNKTKHKTLIGAAITISIVIFSLVAVYFLFQDIIFHRNPNIILYKEKAIESSFSINP